MTTRKMMALGLFSSLLPCVMMGADTTVPLKPVRSKMGGNGYKQVMFEKSNQTSIPFATKSGKLRLKFEKGKLYPDINDDGKFDEKDGSGVAKQKNFSVPITVHGLTLKYEIQFMFGNKQMVLLTGHTELSGKVKGQPFLLVDSNLNGRFNDLQEDNLAVGEGMAPSALGANICLGNAIWSWSLANDKAGMILKPYSGPTGRLTLKNAAEGWGGRLLLVKTDGKFSAVVMTSQPAILLPGAYDVGEVVCTKGKKGNQVELSGHSEKTITITKGANNLTFGAPFSVKMVASKAKDDPRNMTIKDVQLIDSAGFTYSADVDGATSTLKSFVQAGKTRKYLTTMEYG